MAKNLNDIAWESLLKDIPVVSEVDANGFFDIDSKTIKNYREARLMCKIDFKENIPSVFKTNGLSVLSIVNKQYRIARTNPFLDIDQKYLLSKPVDKTFSIPSYLESLSSENITSESKALDAAQASGMLEHLTSDESFLTVRGRVYSQGFDFSLNDAKNNIIDYPIQSVQLEVDGGYEGRNGLSLIEAKMGFSDNMNLRQLLYPQINFSTLLKKPVRTYLFFYQTGGFFHFIPFFYDGKNSSFDYKNHKLFKLEAPKRVEPKELLKTKVNKDLTGFNAPFPQADRFNKVMEVFLKLGELECATKDELFFDFDLVTRQWDYYLNALIWLGLASKDTTNECFVLSEKGISLFEATENERIFEIAKTAFSNDIFNAFLSTDNPIINQSLKTRNGLTSDTTFLRRMQTVKSWKKHIFSLLELNDA
jgi:hypothetical protein